MPPASPNRRTTRQNAPAIAPAREAAFHILRRVGTTAGHADDLLHAPAVSALRPEDRNLATALVLGVLRWQIVLDTRIRPLLARPAAELHPSALLTLRLGVFQLLYMDRIPPHAAVHDAVELARANGAEFAVSLVNAVLRRILRELERAPDQPPRQTLAAATPAEQAHPAWLLARWRRNFGGLAARLICTYDQDEPPSPSLFPGRSAEIGSSDALPHIDDGSRLVAELAAASVSTPRRILDCCAAPGGKTLLLSARHPDAEIVAVDISERRLQAMRLRLDDTPHGGRVHTVVADMTERSHRTLPELQGQFDLILCDAPCSGTGTLARNPEIRHRLLESDLPRQAERQTAILRSALKLLAPEGRLIYSTCSLEPEENEAVVEAVQKDEDAVLQSLEYLTRRLPGIHEPARTRLLESGFSAEGNLRTLPGVLPFDGFFAACFQRN